VLLAALAPAADAADGASVHGILVYASNAKAPADPRLAPYEGPLQRNLPESSFRFAGEGSANFGGSDSTHLDLGSNQRLEIEREAGRGAGIHLKLRWMNGSKVVLSGTFSLQPGVPVILGRRPSGDGDVPIVLVIAR
jgi:hypothetical protein